MGAELHIAGIVVHAHPQRMREAAAAIAGLPGAAIHATSPDGKLVVTLEAPGAREIAAHVDAIQGLDCVLAASMVYQHNEALEKMMEEIGDEGHATGLR